MQEQPTELIPLQTVIEQLTRARNTGELQFILQRFPMLRQPDLDGWLTQRVNQGQTLLERFTYICAREFLAGYLARNTDAARQLMPSLPLVESYPGTLLLKQTNSAAPEQLLKWARQAFTPLRPGVDDDTRGLFLTHFARLLADTRAAAQQKQIPSAALWTALAQSQVLEVAAGYAQEAVDHYAALPDHPEDWKTALRLMDELYRTYARLEPVPPGSTPAEQYHWAIIAYEQVIQQGSWQDAEAKFELACLRHSLGSLCIHFPGEDQARYVERGMGELKQALILLGNERKGEFTPRLEALSPAYREQSARSLNELGSAYLMRAQDGRLENIHQALACYQSALRVKTGPDVIQRLANGHYNLAVAGRICAQEDPQNAEKILRESIQMAQTALLEERQQQFPAEQQAEVYAELGTLYCQIQTHRQENLRAAIRCYDEALRLISREQHPLLWAHIQNHLGNVWYLAVQGQPADALNAAQNCFNLALEVYDEAHYPQKWADVHNNLGVICAQDGALPAAREHFRQAQSKRPVESLPEAARQTAINRGDLEFHAKCWADALEAYQIALRAGEILFQDSLSEAGKRAELADIPALHQRAAYACIQAGAAGGNPSPGAQALKILEQGKARLLSHALRLTTTRPSKVDQPAWKEFEQSAQQVRRLQILADYETGAAGNLEGSFVTGSSSQRAVYERFERAVVGVRQQVPGFLDTPGLAETQALLPDETTALVAFCITEHGSLALIVSQSTPDVTVVPLPTFDRARLNTWLFSYDGWIAACRRKSTTSLRGEALLAELSHELLVPLLSAVESMTPTIQKLIFLPTGGLFLVPLHAAPLPSAPGTDTRLLDQYQISYTPSLQVLRDLRGRRQLTRHLTEQNASASAINDLRAVIGPQVAYPELMRFLLTHAWESANITQGPQAKQAALLQDRASSGAARHFYGHGRFNWNTPLDSGLLLADGWLTLGDLQRQANDLSATALLTLTACESGLPDIQVYPEEYVGLPAGFMQAGVPCVVSTLWPVPELASALLMGEFYDAIRQGLAPAEAMQQAQHHIRQMTNSTVSVLLEGCIDSQPCGDALRKASQHYQEQAAHYPDSQPFHDAYWWAAFTVNGLGQI